MIYADGRQAWWVDGKRHRLDGPAIMRPDGSEEWWVDGKTHRVDGPAIIWTNGTQEWWVGGKRNRLDGPAIIGADGSEYWYVDDNYVDPGFIKQYIKHNPPTKKEQQLLMQYWGEGSS